MRSLLVLAALWAVGCNGNITVTFATGPQELDVSATQLSLPDALRDGSGNIASVSCGPMGMCPANDTITLTCESGVCDPAPKTLSAPVGDVVDVQMLLSDTSELGVRSIDSYEVVEVAYDISLNTLTVPIGEVDVFWGPEAATAVDPSLGVKHFGTIDAIPAGQTGMGTVQIDPDGAAALSDYLVNSSPRVRFFAQTTVDLNPGDPIPDGSLQVTVNATVRAVGRVL